MTYRSLSAIIFSIIVAIEVITFINQPNLTKVVENGKEKKGLFGGYDTVIDSDRMTNRSTKYFTIIGSTLVIGGIITFALPNRDLNKGGDLNKSKEKD